MTDKELLQIVREYITEANKTNSQKDKIEVVKKYSNLKELFNYVYNPFIQFNVTSKNLIKKKDLVEDTDLCLFEILFQLHKREITGHKAIAIINGFIEKNKEYEDEIYKIIDKDLQTRANAKLINKVFKGLIPEFSVQLARKMEDVPNSKKPDFEKEDWFASIKFDGLRCLIVYDGRVIKFLSRTGNEFFTLNNLIPDVEKIIDVIKEPFVLDGEICIMEGDVENFSLILREYNKKDYTIENPKHFAFDLLTLEEFAKQTSKDVFSKRYQKLKSLFNKINLEKIEVAEQLKIPNESGVKRYLTDVFAKGREGLIIRKDICYEGKRSNNMIKLKPFDDGEFKVEKIETGPMRIIEDGKEKLIKTVTNVIVKYKGNEVSVGSGFLIKERQYFYDNPDELKGKTINVRWMEESFDKDGKISLRHPVYKGIVGDKRREV